MNLSNKSKKELKEKIKEQQLLLDNINTQIWHLQDKEHYGAVNQAHADFLGVAKEDIAYKSLYQMLSKTEAEICIASNQEVFEEEKTVYTEEWAQNSKGQARLLAITKIPNFNQQDEIENIICSAEDITEQAKINKLIKENKEKFETIFNQDKTIKLIINPDNGQIVDANQAAEKFYGYSYEELTSKFIQEINQLSSREVEAEMRRAKEKEEDFFSFPHQIASGATKYVEVYSNPIKIGGRKLLISSIHDVTKRKKVEEKLKETKQLYNNVINTQQEMICRFKADTTLTFVNQAYCEHLGEKEEELLGTKFLKFIPQEEHQRILDHLANLAAGEEAITYEHQVDTAEDIIAWQRWTDYPIYNETGELIGYQSIGLDITDRKQHEQELKLLSEMIEQSDDSIIQTDIKGRIEYANQAAEELFGWSRKELQGKRPDLFNAEEDSEQIQQEIYKTIASGQTYEGEILNQRKDGSTFWCQIKVIPLLDERDQIYSYMGIQRDVSERKLREKKLKEAKEKAEVANRAKSEFIANMSHEIRTPLNSIVGFSELLLEQELNQKKKTKLRTIVNSGQHLKAIISDILDFSRIEAEKVELEKIKFSLSHLLLEIKNMFSMKDKDLEFSLQIDGSVPSLVKGDKYRINQIIINLVSNAFKFTSKGSVQIYCSYKQQNIIIEVADTGVGIPKSKGDKLFTAFEQVDSSIIRKYGGTGLGLAIVKRLVNLMDGSIDFESKVGQGTTFIVKLPLEVIDDKNLVEVNELSKDNYQQGLKMIEAWIKSDPEIEDLTLQAIQELPIRVANLEQAILNFNQQETERIAHKLKGLAANFNLTEVYELAAIITDLARADNIDIEQMNKLLTDLKNVIAIIPNDYLAEEVAENKFKILLAEDESLNQLLIKEILSDFDLEIDAVNNGQKVLDRLEVKEYDLLLLDIQMPVMSGLEVMENLKKKVPIIAITASVEKQVADKCLALGCEEYLTKPLNKNELRQIVKSYLGVKE